MRSFIAIAAFGLAGMAASAVPANAATWKCNGANYVCSKSASHTAGKSRVSHKAASHSRHAYAPRKAAKHSRYASRNRVVRRNHASSKQVRRHRASYAAKGGSYSGMASYYWQGQMTASGVRFNPSALTAAHRSLPFGTRVRVTNRSNGRSVVVTINDRGPFIAGRIIDLSRAAAQVISMTGAGVAPVSVVVLGRS